MSGHEKRATGKEVLTSWGPESEGLVRTQKEKDRARRTHFLEAVERGAHRNMNGN